MVLKHYFLFFFPFSLSLHICAVNDQDVHQNLRPVPVLSEITDNTNHPVYIYDDDEGYRYDKEGNRYDKQGNKYIKGANFYIYTDPSPDANAENIEPTITETPRHQTITTETDNLLGTISALASQLTNDRISTLDDSPHITRRRGNRTHNNKDTNLTEAQIARLDGSPYIRRGRGTPLQTEGTKENSKSAKQPFLIKKKAGGCTQGQLRQ